MWTRLYGQTPQPEVDRIKIAELAKIRGNEYYGCGKFEDAIVCYNEAIKLWPNCEQYYGNRCAAYLMSGKINEALHDAIQSTNINPNFTKGHIRAGKCLIEMGKVHSAVECFDRAILLQDCPKIKSQKEAAVLLLAKEQQAFKCYNSREYDMAESAFAACLDEVPKCSSYKFMRGECLAHLGKLDTASEIAKILIERDRPNSDAIFLLGLCHYYQNSVDEALCIFKHARKLDPMHPRSNCYLAMLENLIRLKEHGNLCFQMSNYLGAISLYSQALAIDPLHRVMNSVLFHNRASCYMKLKNYQAAIDNCGDALRLDSKYIKALQKRALAYTELGKFSEAIEDYSAVWQLDASDANSNTLQEARRRLLHHRQSEITPKQKYYYQILAITGDASVMEIKRAYHKLAKLHHPDRHSNNSSEVRKEKEAVFKDIVEAYTVLSDPQKKAEYDRRMNFTGFRHINTSETSGHSSDNLNSTRNGCFPATFPVFTNGPPRFDGTRQFTGCKRTCPPENNSHTNFQRNFKSRRRF